MALLGLRERPWPVRWALALIAATTVLVLPVVQLDLLGRAGDDAVELYVYNAIFVVAAGLCAYRWVLDRREGLPWLLLGLSLLALLAGNVFWALALVNQRSVPIPSWADLGFLLMYPPQYAALVILLRRRVRTFRSGLMLDAAVSALTLAAMSVALVVAPVAATADQSPLGFATNLAYPLGDLVLIALTGVALTLTGWRPGRAWTLLALGFAVYTLSDGIYLVQSANGTFVGGTALGAGWPAAAVLIALAALQAPELPRAGAERDEDVARNVVAPTAAALLALAVLSAGAFTHVHPIAIACASAALLAAMVRMGLAFRELRILVRAREESLTDELTGLPNRRALHRTLAAEGHASLSFALLDLNGFKEVNDSLGHAAGDEVLVEVAARLRATVQDAVCVARLGGDEFAVAVPGPSAEALGERLGRCFEAPVEVAGLAILVDAAIGLAVSPVDASTASGLLRCADVAMYSAKSRNRRFERFMSDTTVTSAGDLALGGEVPRALARGELEVHYQPKLDARTGAVAGVEALVRWRHPERGLLAPGQFLPLVEHTTLMRPLTLAVLRLAVADLARWSADGVGFGVAVNIPPACVLDHEFPSAVTDVLAAHGIAPDRLTLELTETAAMSDPARTVPALATLRGLGVGLSLDDFGTGYSSLSVLRELAFDELKVDRSFVSGLARNGGESAIVRATIDLARGLGLRVVAEGVEDAATHQRLRSLGCDAVQGFHFCRPLPADELMTWLAARTTPPLHTAALRSRR